MTKEVFGANKSEKWDIGCDITTIIAGAIGATAWFVNSFENIWASPLIVLSSGFCALSTYQVFNRIEMIAIRIRLEESDSRAELLADIREELGWDR